jgi:hypothetical protein
MIDNRSGAEALGQGLDAQQRTGVRIGPRRKISSRPGDLRTLRCQMAIMRAFLTQNGMSDKCAAAASGHQPTTESVSDEAMPTFSTVSLASRRGSGP